MNNSQLLKGVLQGCVLMVISKKDVYGYELVQRLQELGFTDIIGGTVYPLLQKLEKNGQLTSVRKASSEGPTRKYYSITQQGRDQIGEFIDQWQALETVVNQIISTKDGDDNGK
ncbi:PadR family transcriptional regulator [Companilactobacillus sp.]|uniref:PadR family transcriptional regulator n=1 Tax=Companilactobacillus sp. TaxID=2767905 RepID=UPI0025BDE8D5|nr:PadR family transcriptional regulator [Companilactobacillus sp.]MCH4009672.1 PadR family transcriptional regulator [Companilactobacillus sp.]MCH4052652.1 PadR family transcriptional regulator [Companilactobacillus sp.]MCH4077614.1 PadR family transcriptional regulator [Companilactobacillus sp.]MCH4126190.1 PadR family transcriptional regulator [Companilactobacillus sp.]MCI1311898.1 PadR family transcriptional regulator [Companilactobacillus sp.]